MKGAYRWRLKHISIHALREEGDGAVWPKDSGAYKFLSTPSARKATEAVAWRHPAVKEFLSTPSARKATVWVM